MTDLQIMGFQIEAARAAAALQVQQVEAMVRIGDAINALARSHENVARAIEQLSGPPGEEE